MNAQYYLSPGKEGWEKFLASTSLDSLQKLQMGVIRVDRIWIDEASAEWQIDYRSIAPIVDSTLEAAGKELAAAFSLHAVHWHSLNKLKETATPKAKPATAPSPKKEFTPEVHNPEPIAVKSEPKTVAVNTLAPIKHTPKTEVKPKPIQTTPAAENPAPMDEDPAYQRALNLVYGKEKENYILGDPFEGKARPLKDVIEEENKVIVEGNFVKYMDKDGTMQAFNEKELRTGFVMLTFSLADMTGGIYIKQRFPNIDECIAFKNKLKIGMKLRVLGDVAPDKFSFDELVLTPKSIQILKEEQREDHAAIKRVELHCHTKMSKLDGVTDIEKLIDTAVRFGHKALAITDHGVVQAFPTAYLAAKDTPLKLIFGCEGYLISNEDGDILRDNIPHTGRIKSNHIIILAKNIIGLRNLYQLITLSHLTYLRGTRKRANPTMPRELIEEHREGLLLGSACEIGELYQAVEAGASDEELEKIASFYDYLEIQPIGNNMFLTREGKFTVEQLKANNKRIYELGKRMGKFVVGTCDAHFLNPEDSRIRAILQFNQGYKDYDQQAPLYYRTTEEMLQEFAYLGENEAYEICVTNTNKIASMVEKITPVPEETQLYAPNIVGAEKIIKDRSYARARELYGDPLPSIVDKRLKQELNSIIPHGYAVLYLIALKLVKKSLDDGYLVGSRGSVGSSLVATMTNITEVNPLVPHYRCPNCRHSEFFTNNEYASGFDMPEKDCPNCGTPMVRDGHNIPFAVFMGFKGDKVPDIDLNFSGDYQPKAHKYTEELFGRDNVCRAGTISTIAEKNAWHYITKYYENKGQKVHPAFTYSLIEGLTGVKSTTGQHPGGIMVIPRNLDIHYITPMNYPADDRDKGVVTTHYDYHKINDRLVKLDILGHDDPTMIKMLEELTGINAREIPIGDKDTMAIFTSPDVLGVTEKQIGTDVGTYGIPECGTTFTRGMIHDLKPQKFSELVRISGYSHGTNVWLNNAKDLIDSGKSKYDTISTRDDVMTTLIAKGVKPLLAFKTMEYVRKGKAAKKGLEPEMKEAMTKAGIEDWYLDSCEKIKYLFPKAHAVAYVLMAYRIAYFKVHYPLAYYAAYFTIRAKDFDAMRLINGKDAIKQFIKTVYQQGFKAEKTDQSAVTYLELVVEMMERGFAIKPIDLYESEAARFSVTDDKKGIRIPLSALAGVGVQAAEGIVEARKNGVKFISKEDLRNRAHIGQAVIDKMTAYGMLNDLPDTDQINLF
jgi:DNA polymerase-3 subunit alpha (Gram-positive type)